VLTIRHPAAPLAGEVGEPVGERRFRGLFEALTSGFALHEIVLDAAGKACDYRFLEANPAFEAITSLDRSRIIGRCASAVVPQLDRRWIERYAAVALTGDGAQFDDFRSDLDRQYRLTAYCPEYGQVAVIYDDVTALRRPLPDVGSHTDHRRTAGEQPARSRTLARNVNPGGWAIESERPIATLLGSCVAVCLWDPALRIGGLNHFMLPRYEKSANHDLDVLLCGNFCMEALLNGMIGRGAHGSSACRARPLAVATSFRRSPASASASATPNSHASGWRARASACWHPT
jgi:hypothetical protein